MKTLLFSFWLAFAPLIASSDQPPTNQPSVNVVVIVLTSTNQLPMVLNAITNAVPSAVIHQESRTFVRLKTKIALMEQRFKEVYAGIPETYIGDGSPTSQTQLNKMINIWKQKNEDAASIKAEKDKLEKMRNE